jgi:hypothetical protein
MIIHQSCGFISKRKTFSLCMLGHFSIERVSLCVDLFIYLVYNIMIVLSTCSCKCFTLHGETFKVSRTLTFQGCFNTVPFIMATAIVLTADTSVITSLN